MLCYVTSNREPYFLTGESNSHGLRKKSDSRCAQKNIFRKNYPQLQTTIDLKVEG